MNNNSTNNINTTIITTTSGNATKTMATPTITTAVSSTMTIARKPVPLIHVCKTAICYGTAGGGIDVPEASSHCGLLLCFFWSQAKRTGPSSPRASVGPAPQPTWAQGSPLWRHPKSSMPGPPLLSVGDALKHPHLCTIQVDKKKCEQFRAGQGAGFP